MKRALLMVVFTMTVACALGVAEGRCLVAQDDAPVFSGPQIGERVAPFEAKSLFRSEDQKVRSIAFAGSDCLDVVFFFHGVTRPGFAVLRTVANYVASLERSVKITAVFLASDVLSKQQWGESARQSLPRSVEYVVSIDGPEGPGSLGLNRHVEITVLLVRESKVIANFALVQPSDAVDSPKIAEGIAKALQIDPPGSEALAAFRELRAAERDRAMGAGTMPEVDLRPWLGPVIRLAASVEDVETAAQRVAAEAEKNEAFRRALGEVCKRIIDQGKLQDYGTRRAQEYLREWAEKYGDLDKT